MSDLGNLDDRQFQEFARRIGDEVRTKKMLAKVKKRADIVSNFAFKLTKEKTPIDTGSLKRAWKKSDVEYTSNEVVVKISNDTDYASFIEYGHRLRNGGWYQGYEMNKRAMDKTFEKKMNKAFHNDLDNTLKKLMGE